MLRQARRAPLQSFGSHCSGRWEVENEHPRRRRLFSRLLKANSPAIRSLSHVLTEGCTRTPRQIPGKCEETPEEESGQFEQFLVLGPDILTEKSGHVGPKACFGRMGIRTGCQAESVVKKIRGSIRQVVQCPKRFPKLRTRIRVRQPGEEVL